MRVFIHLVLIGVILSVFPVSGQQKSTLTPAPTVVTAAQAVDLAKFDGQLIQLPGAKVVHADSAQLFMFGEPKGRQAHVLIPAPAIDAAHVGDVVEVTGRVRRYSTSDFEHDYSWYKKADYPDVHAGDWVIVANSVRTPEGTQLVPGNTISDVAPDAPDAAALIEMTMEVNVKPSIVACFIGCLSASAVTLTAQTVPASGTPAAQSADMPAEYKQVLDALGKQGDFKDGVLKVNIPRSDLRVAVDGIATPTPFGFGGWVALEKGTGGMNVMMGDLVLTEAEVNPVMSALLDNGLEVTAVHNHFFFESPRIFYMHVHGHGAPADLASKLKPALALIGKNTAPASAAGKPLEGTLDTARLASTIGTPGETNAGVYKITIGRPDIKLEEMGAPINARMGLNTWAAFYGSDADAVVAGDVAMLDGEVQPVLKALRANGMNVVAIHHHMTGTTPTVFFLHYWGRGPAATLAAGVKAAIDKTGPGR